MTTINNNINSSIRQPEQKYEKYTYEIIVDGQKQSANIEVFSNNKVNITYEENGERKVITTDKDGLLKFSKKYSAPYNVYDTTQDNDKSKNIKDNLTYLDTINKAFVAMINNSIMAQKELEQQRNLMSQMNNQQNIVDNTNLMNVPGMGVVNFP